MKKKIYAILCFLIVTVLLHNFFVEEINKRILGLIYFFQAFILIAFVYSERKGKENSNFDGSRNDEN